VTERRRDRWKFVLCYFPLLGLIPLVSKGSSREVRWHARNGLLLFGTLVVVVGGATVVSLLFQRLGCFYSIAMFFAGVLYLIFATLGVVKAWQGERLMFPLISRYADR
jgi:uncharacterized membrane protein